jgi:hypothetical protein
MTGPALALITRCRRLGIILAADGDRLRYRPVVMVDGELRAQLAEHKAEVLAILAGNSQTANRADDLPEPWKDLYEERAAIMEYDANMPRVDAERLALADIARTTQAGIRRT